MLSVIIPILSSQNCFIMVQDIKVSVDAAVFSFEKGRGLYILLIKRGNPPFKDQWALPGGLVNDSESVEAAAIRELKEETGISVKALEQLHSFSDPKRDPRNRVVSVAYLGMIRKKEHEVSAQTDATDAQWFNIKKLPKLAFDHQGIVKTAIHRLRNKLNNQPFGLELLDGKFSFADFEQLYHSLLGTKFDRKKFKKKIMSYGLLDELENGMRSNGSKPDKLFRFNLKKYHELYAKGYHFDQFLVN